MAASVAISRTDVQAFIPGASDNVVDQLLAGTIARAAVFAPCITAEDLDPHTTAAIKDILVGVVVRAVEMGSGETTTLIAGPMQQTVDTTKRRAARFRPDEIRELQGLCKVKRGGAFTITMGYDATDALGEDWTPPEVQRAIYGDGFQ